MTQTEIRLTNLRAAMAETGTDLVVLGPGAHMHWLLGFHPHGDERPCLLLIGREREVFLMPALNAEGTRAETDIAFCEWADENGPDAALKQALDRIGANGQLKVVLDETMRADFALLVLGALPGARHDFTLDTVGALRMRKDAGEYARLKENALIDDRAMQAGFAALKPGVSELEIAEGRRKAGIHHRRFRPERRFPAPCDRQSQAPAWRCHRHGHRRPQGRVSK